jgi:hypothetical protein
MEETHGSRPGWEFREEGQAPPQDQASQKTPHRAVTWTASEFVAHQKDASWHLTLIAGVLILCGFTYIFTKDVISVITIFVVGILFAVLANKKPRELPYMIDTQGITIGDKFYPYALFKSFAINQEGAIAYINLMPLKRFMPERAIYYPPEDEAEILSILADYLPHDQRKEQGVDRLMKRLRF